MNAPSSVRKTARGYFISERKSGKVQLFLPLLYSCTASSKVYIESVNAAMVLSRTLSSSDIPAKKKFIKPTRNKSKWHHKFYRWFWDTIVILHFLRCDSFHLLKKNFSSAGRKCFVEIGAFTLTLTSLAHNYYCYYYC